MTVDVTDKNTVKRWGEMTIAIAFLAIEHIDLHNSLMHLAHFNIPEIKSPHNTAAAGVGFDPDGTVKMRTVHDAVLCIYILYPTRRLAANDDTAMAILHETVFDNNVFRGQVNSATIFIFPAFNSNTVISVGKMAVFDPDIFTRLRVTTVIIGAVADRGNAIDGYILTLYRVQDPKRCIADGYTLYKYIFAMVKFQEAWPKIMSLAKNSFFNRYLILVHLQQ